MRRQGTEQSRGGGGGVLPPDERSCATALLSPAGAPSAAPERASLHRMGTLPRHTGAAWPLLTPSFPSAVRARLPPPSFAAPEWPDRASLRRVGVAHACLSPSSRHATHRRDLPAMLARAFCVCGDVERKKGVTQ